MYTVKRAGFQCKICRFQVVLLNMCEFTVISPTICFRWSATFHKVLSSCTWTIHVRLCAVQLQFHKMHRKCPDHPGSCLLTTAAERIKLYTGCYFFACSVFSLHDMNVFVTDFTIDHVVTHVQEFSSGFLWQFFVRNCVKCEGIWINMWLPCMVPYSLYIWLWQGKSWMWINVNEMKCLRLSIDVWLPCTVNLQEFDVLIYIFQVEVLKMSQFLIQICFIWNAQFSVFSVHAREPCTCYSVCCTIAMAKIVQGGNALTIWASSLLTTAAERIKLFTGWFLCLFGLFTPWYECICDRFYCRLCCHSRTGIFKWNFDQFLSETVCEMWRNLDLRGAHVHSKHVAPMHVGVLCVKCEGILINVWLMYTVNMWLPCM